MTGLEADSPGLLDSYSAAQLAVGLAKRCASQNVRLVIVPGPAEVHRLFQTFPALPFVEGP